MRKKISLLLIITLGVILTFVLVACNTTAQSPEDLPDYVGVEDAEIGEEVNTYLTFTFTTQATSVFKSIYIDEFDISSIKYTVIYTDGAITTEGQKGNLSEDMLDDESKLLIKQAGHHMIRASLQIDENTTASGSFPLHLMQRGQTIEKVKLTFELNNSKASFGSTDASGDKAIVWVDEGASVKSWEEFVNTFPMKSLEGKALQSVRIGDKEYSATSFSEIKFNNDLTIKTNWTENYYYVNFKLNVPEDATLISGAVDPTQTFESRVAVVRGQKAISPKSEALNVYNGYYFAGWYLDANSNGKWDESDTVWSFAKPITSDNITLVGHWTSRSYSFTLYTMGGNFSANTTNHVVEGNAISSDELAKQAGFTIVEAVSQFSLKEGNLQNIVISGFAYGHNYNEYIIKVQLFQDDDKVTYLTLADIVGNLIKGSSSYTVVDNVYADYQCTTLADISKVHANLDGSDGVGYVKWKFNDPDKNATDYAKLRLERLSSYYVDVLFKGGISKKADGSLRLDKIADESVNEIIIPAEIIYQGETHPITEISANACMNLKALVKIDMSEASNLTKIGEAGFKYCPHLSEVVMPTTGNIKELGKEIFAESSYEKNYAQSGANAIIINGVLYKYVANDRAQTTSIDLSTSEFESVVRIADGAFADCTNLVSITLGDSIATIDNGAFVNCSALQNVLITSSSKLSYIGESAFDGTKVISSVSNHYKSDYKAVIIGGIYYRFIDTQATDATIPDGIKYIAPHAFLDCTKVENIMILDASGILSIGKSAFSATKWVQRADNKSLVDGYVVINNILCDYPGNNGENITLPSGGKTTIVEDAFYTSAQAVRTVKFGKNIAKIEGYAFRGMPIVESFIFSEVSVGADGLVGAPQLSQNAFADATGKLVNNVKFFFSASVINYLDSLSKRSAVSNDEITLSWLRLYQLNTANFVAEKIDAVWIDQRVMPTTLLDLGNGKNALESLFDLNPSLFNKALIVMGNTGVTREEALSFTANEVNLVPIVKDDASFGSYYEEGVDKYVVKFKYADSVDGCHINANDSNVYVVKVVKAVKGTPSFYDSDNYQHNNIGVNLDGKNSGDYYINGFAQKEDVTVPTFYTSYNSANHKFTFKYNDFDGVEHEIDNVHVNGFATSAERQNATASFVVDFYGIGEYRFELTYNVEEAKIVSFEQVGAISIPLNSNANESIRNFYAELIGEDKERERVALSSANGFSVISGSLDSSTLGIHTMTVKYLSQKVDSALTGTIVYSVVLEADESLFTYEVIDTTAKTARIVSCSQDKASTIVIPSTCTINGDEYTVTRIGTANSSRGVFEGFKNLKAVYLAQSIKYISNNTFKDCTYLANVYTAENVNVAFAPLTNVNWTAVGDEIISNNEVHQNVKIVNLNGITLESDDTLAIGAKYSQTDASGKKYVYTVVAVDIALEQKVEVFLPDTIQQNPSITYGKLDIVPNMYSSESGLMFTTSNHVTSSLVEIGNNAFSGCESLKSIDLSKASKLDRIGACAFQGSGLVQIDLSSNTALKAIESQTFEDCRSLETVKLSSSIDHIYAQAFKKCTSLATIDGGSGSIVVDSTAYNQCGKLTKAPKL